MHDKITEKLRWTRKCYANICSDVNHKISICSKKAIRTRIAYPSSDLTPQYKLEDILDEEKNFNWERAFHTPFLLKNYKKTKFFVRNAYYLDYLRFFMVRGAKSTFSSSLIFLETPHFKVLTTLNQLVLKKKVVTLKSPIWVSEEASAWRTQGTKRTPIKIPPQQKSSDPLYTSNERKATGSFSETLHLEEDNEQAYNVISESFRNFYLGERFLKYKSARIEIPRLLALKSTKEVNFQRLNKKPYSKKKKTGKLLVKTLFSYYFLFFATKKTSSWAAVASLLKTKNLRAFRIDLKFFRIFD